MVQSLTDKITKKEFVPYERQTLPESLQEINPLKFTEDNECIQFLENAKKKNQSITAHCIKVNTETGIVTLNLGVKNVIGYIPLEEVTYKLDPSTLKVHIGRALNLLNKNVTVFIKKIEYNSKTETYEVLCSRKEHVSKIYNQYKEDIKSNKLGIGSILRGVVAGFADTGVFIDLGGDVLGIVGIGDIAWAYVKNPQDFLSIGEEVEVVIRSLKEDPLKFTLSRKLLLPSWDVIDDYYKEGDVVVGKVKNRLPSGIFVQLDHSFEGLANFPPFKVSYGDEVNVKVSKIDKARNRMRLTFITNY